MADTKISALTAITAAAAAQEFPVNDAGTSKKITLAEIAGYMVKRIAGSSGAAGDYETWQNLTADTADQTSVTPAVIMTTTGVGAGTWYFKYILIYQTAATTTGIRLNVNHTGTVGQFQSDMWFPDTSATAATGVGKGLATAATGATYSSFPERAINTTTFASVGVSAANVDIPVYVEGIIVVTATGSLELKLGTEIAASAVRIMADSCLILKKIE